MVDLQTPIILIVFNRPASTARVLSALAEVAPRRLFVVGDGPRSGHATDGMRVKQVRELFDCLAWPCDLVTDFAATNLGCRRRVVSGLTWAFDQVEEAIILEDDIIPSRDFFRFCGELLGRYRDDDRIGSISGMNFVGERYASDSSYAFSKYNLFWGWATWRRAWARYDDAMTCVGKSGAEGLDALLARTFTLYRERVYWKRVLQRTACDRINSWGYRWLLSCWQAGMLGIAPRVSMVENIGVGHDATHTRAGLYEVGPIGEMVFPLSHPRGVVNDVQLDRAIEDRIYSKDAATRAAWLMARLRRLLP
jgi:hypothetical protein